MIDNKIKREINKAVRALGNKTTPYIRKIAYNRYSVFIGEACIGIYDVDKHTFVD